MYPIKPPNVYVHESVATHPVYMQRVTSVMEGLADPVSPTIYGDADLPDMLRDGLLSGRIPMGTLEKVPDPSLLFNRFRFDGRAREHLAPLEKAGVNRLRALDLLGYRAFSWANYNKEGDPNRHDKVCRPCWRVHLQNGCIHKCAYCGLGGLLISAVNVDEYCTWFRQLIDRHPWQQTYLLDDDGDPPGLEPELGCLGDLIEFFGTLEDRYLIIHTKTWNTEWMRDLDHNGNTIIVWSLSGPTQSTLIEPDTGSTDQRIEAARLAQEAGYQIRYKFKPIIPVKDWREEAAATIKLLFERTDPDVISLCTFMWMDLDELTRRLPVESLDERFLEAADAARDEVSDTVTRPFPKAVRREIYEFHLREIRRWNPDIPVSLSTEQFSLWKEMEDLLGYDARSYPCGCGPFSGPGAPRLVCDPFVTAERLDRGDIPGVWPEWR